ncbi:PRC-barrel-like [Acididesulfobacillus acetoxydans]|uniref:PRC-barrel domain protein n=1 Tax=Acididesulfobacillus acetoxydans TaxID=1561005 RepID=A0A8S0XBC6_9FIRM|nr:PRC-barrel domain-containing protein [Acididesulfobacillus acetoxydans]CAA7601066.1 PRC-barrel-like [Acididesulfobacillus acetoxydans]CEJ06940.1 PRC-barrel domain protein [Acididesulfobacillus acetoxydans]
MKTSQEIIGLRIISIADATDMGLVEELVLSAQGGSLEFVILDRPSDYFGAKVIAFADILGIGEFALTIPSPQVIQDVAHNTAAQELLGEGVRVKATRVLTKTGQLIGEVEEVVFDEKAGKIAACLYRTPDGQHLEVPADQIITYGKDLLIVEVPPADIPARISESNSAAGKAEGSGRPAEDGESAGPKPAEKESGFNAFERKQLEYFLGKTVEKDIVLDNGETWAAGRTMTPEVLKNISKHKTLMEITAHLQK